MLSALTHLVQTSHFRWVEIIKPVCKFYTPAKGHVQGGAFSVEEHGHDAVQVERLPFAMHLVGLISLLRKSHRLFD